jgi:hypothetical protein
MNNQALWADDGTEIVPIFDPVQTELAGTAHCLRLWMRRSCRWPSRFFINDAL